MTTNLNLDVLKSPEIQQHNSLLPNEHVRCLMTGVSRSGKTQRLINMLLQPKFLDYNHLILFTPTVNQTVYHLIKEGFNNGLSKQDITYLIKNINEFKQKPNQKGITNEDIDDIIQSIIEEKEESSENCSDDEEKITVDYYTPNDLKDNPLPRCEELDPKLKHIFIADDCMNRKEMQPVIADYFTNSRHANCSSFYLNQKYTNRDTVIRDNANLILLFKTPTKPIETLYHDYVENDLDWPVFNAAISKAFKTDYNFITIDKTTSDLDRKYRVRFDRPLIINSATLSNKLKKIRI